MSPQLAELDAVRVRVAKTGLELLAGAKRIGDPVSVQTPRK
jgi:hypothetical protein